MANIAETLGTAPLAAQIVRTANITGTQGAAPVVKKASQIVGAARVAETPGAAPVVK